MIKRLHPYVYPEPSWGLRAEEAVRISGNVIISKSRNKSWSERLRIEGYKVDGYQFGEGKGGGQVLAY